MVSVLDKAVTDCMHCGTRLWWMVLLYKALDTGPFSITCVTIIFFHCAFFFFKVTPAACGSSHPRFQIRVAAASQHQSHSNPGYELCLQPTHSLQGLGIKPVSSYILVGFVTADPQWELQDKILNFNTPIYSFSFTVAAFWHL